MFVSIAMAFVGSSSSRTVSDPDPELDDTCDELAPLNVAPLVRPCLHSFEPFGNLQLERGGDNHQIGVTDDHITDVVGDSPAILFLLL